jgi:hypothetical protein
MTQSAPVPASRRRHRLAGLAFGAAAIAVLNAAFLLALVAVQHLDGAAMERSLLRSVERGDIALEPWPQLTVGPRTFTLDNYTDCLALSTAIDGGEASALRRAVEARILSEQIRNPCEHLIGHLAGRAAWTAAPYFRYWHGTQVYLRPMLLYRDLGTIRRVNYAITGACFALFATAAVMTLPWSAAAALLALLLALTDAVVMPLVTAHVAGVIVTLLTCTAALAALRLRPIEGWRPLRWIALVSGAVFNFVDFLVNPPFTPALLAFVVLAAWTWRGGSPGTAREQIREAAWIAGTWFAAYAATWTAKWMIAAAVLGPRQVVGDILYAAHRRATGDAGGPPVAIGDATLANLAMIGWTEVATVAIVTVAGLAALLARHGDIRRRLAQFGVLSSPALIPLLWMETLRGHSVEHALFAYRSAALSLIVPAVAVIVLWASARADASRRGLS